MITLHYVRCPAGHIDAHLHGFNDDRESREYIVHHTVWDPVMAIYLNGVGLLNSYFLKQTDRLGNTSQ